MADKFYVTTPLYYVNASPHIGHSYTTIAADTLARYMRETLGSDRVFFLTGTDEHGLKIQRAADELKLSPGEFADKMVVQFKDLWSQLNISYDDFIRTTQDRHVKVVQQALAILYENKQIYLDKYTGFYCTPDETFWIESQLKDGNCPDCGRPVEKISETNYFFKLSQHQDWLVEYIKKNPDFVRPQYRYNEVLRFLELNKLNDLCISRPKERLAWGIPLPFSAEHVTYVWFDALINYISAVGDFDANNKYVSKWWPADLQLIGKDILRQHAVYWPIMLHALNIEPPRTVFAHGWWLIDDNKMSKSRGQVVNPLDMVHEFGIDAYRYFILRDVPFGLDGNFSQDAIIKRVNSDLANDLGNLLYRTLTMIEKYFEGNIPGEDITARSEQAKAIGLKMKNLGPAIKAHLCSSGDFNFSASLEAIWEIINMANKYIEDTKPWNLAKANKTAGLKEFILVLVDCLRGVQSQIAPFMPQTARLIAEQLGKDKIKKGKPLFPRIEK
ncbi:MAG: methionine--tRNA ligase [Omnitrophica WOR_2 bacterium RBG_13_44_8b]|nr:MAG: methionine--tRNA ligase [Omnitrophica WOR_2 bacterium RBG_13_44_8b]